MATPKKKPEDLLKTGRPTLYSEELATLVCERVATCTHGLSKMCKLNPDLPNQSTINLWRYKHPEFSTQYAQAKLKQCDLLAEECLDIADNDSQDGKVMPDGSEVCNTEYIARSRLRVDTRKWLASKLLPKQYGQHAEENKEQDKAVIAMLIDKLAE